MALPTLFKTHQYRKATIAAQGSAALCCIATLIEIKNSMLGQGAFNDRSNVSVTPTGAWTVVGSSNGTTGGCDGVDRWVSPAAVAAGGNNAWIVVRHAELGIDVMLYALGLLPNMHIKISHAGFGAARGGTNGGATTYPTAVDEQFALQGTSWGGPGTDIPTSLICVLCTDGTFSAYMLRGGLQGCWRFFRPQSSPVEWTNSATAHCYGSTGTGDQATFPNSATKAASINNSNGLIQLSLDEPGNMINGTQARVAITAANPFSGKWPIWSVQCHSDTLSQFFVAGHLQDIFIGVNAHATGDCYDDSGATARQFLKLQHWVIPWDGSNPTINPGGSEPVKTIRNAEYAVSIAVATTDPVIVNFVPPALPRDELRFDVVGAYGALAVFDGAAVVYRDFGVGRFVAPYTGSREPITNGYRFHVWTADGWTIGRPHISIEVV